MAIGTSNREAVEVVATFPTHLKPALLVEAVNVIIGEKLGLDLEIEPPSRKAVSVVEAAAKRDISGVLLIYLIGVQRFYPVGFRQRLSSDALEDIADHDDLRTESGWRIFDTHQRQEEEGHIFYSSDKNFLWPIIEKAREAGEIPKTQDTGLRRIPDYSRLGLIPREIEEVVTPKVDELLVLPAGTMHLPSLREAMMASSLYGFVAIDVNEWQTGGLNKAGYHPAGLEFDHSGMSDLYYDIRSYSKHVHNPVTGFRLIGAAPK